MLTVHMEEHYRRATRIERCEEVLHFFDEHRIRAESVGAVFRIGFGRARGDARAHALAARLVVDPEDVESRTLQERGKRLFGKNPASIVIGPSDTTHHARDRNVGRRTAGTHLRVADEVGNRAKARRRVAFVSRQAPVGGARRFAHHHDEERGTRSNRRLRSGVDRTANANAVGAVVRRDRPHEGVHDPDGSDPVAKRLVFTHESRKGLEVDEQKPDPDRRTHHGIGAVAKPNARASPDECGPLPSHPTEDRGRRVVEIAELAKIEAPGRLDAQRRPQGGKRRDEEGPDRADREVCGCFARIGGKKVSHHVGRKNRAVKFRPRKDRAAREREHRKRRAKEHLREKRKKHKKPQRHRKERGRHRKREKEPTRGILREDRAEKRVVEDKRPPECRKNDAGRDGKRAGKRGNHAFQRTLTVEHHHVERRTD